MKLTDENKVNKFLPVTITLDSKKEVAILAAALARVGASAVNEVLEDRGCTKLEGKFLDPIYEIYNFLSDIVQSDNDKTKWDDGVS